MKINKFIYCIFIFIIFISFSFTSFADDEESENISNILTYIPTSSSLDSEPKINSRAAIVYDRNSGTILYGKNEK